MLIVDAASVCRLLTDVGTVNGGTGGLEAKTDILVPSAVAGGLASSLGVLEDGLLLESLFGLDTELNVRHDGRLLLGKVKKGGDRIGLEGTMVVTTTTTKLGSLR